MKRCVEKFFVIGADRACLASGMTLAGSGNGEGALRYHRMARGARICLSLLLVPHSYVTRLTCNLLSLLSVPEVLNSNTYMHVHIGTCYTHICTVCMMCCVSVSLSLSCSLFMHVLAKTGVSKKGKTVAFSV